MDEDRPATIGTIAHQISSWIGIIGALLSVLSFCIILGMQFGPIKVMPAQLEAISVQLGEIKDKTNLGAYQITDLKTKYEAMNTQITTAMTEQRKLGEDAKKLEIMLAQLAVTVVNKVDFLEWKAELERRNNIVAPQLRKTP